MSASGSSHRRASATLPIQQSGHAWESLPEASNADAKYEHISQVSPVSSPKSPHRAHIPSARSRPVSPTTPKVLRKNSAPGPDDPAALERLALKVRHSSSVTMESLESLKAPQPRSSFSDVEAAVKQALEIVNAGLGPSAGGSLDSSTPNESDPVIQTSPVGSSISREGQPRRSDQPIFLIPDQLPTEIPVMMESHVIADGDEAHESAGDKWLQATKSISHQMVAELADSTTVYHIGTPTLFPSSANPSITLSTSSDPPEKLNPVILSPLLDESNALGRMVSVKPVPGQKTSSSHVLKMIVLGDASVGKTALIQRFVNGFFQPLPYKPTVGADFYSQKLEFTLPASGETITLTLQIWDTAGQERYKSLASSFYRGADICVIVEDCTKPQHLKSVAQWHEDFLRHAAPFEPASFPFMFLLNKSDLLGDAEAVALEKNWRKQVSDRFGVPQSRAGTVSAKSGENVEDSLFLATKIGAQRTLKSYNQIRAQQTGGVINLNNRPGEEDSFFNNCLC